jgi:acyl dehydratase
MPLNYDQIMAIAPIEVRHAYTVRDTILYALGVGVAIDRPNDPDALRFVYEDGLLTLPTMPVILAHPGFWARDPQYGLEWRKVVHGEQSTEIHAPLPVEGAVRGVTVIDAVYDKGADKGAVVCMRRDLFSEETGDLLATVRQTSFHRGDGGFGGNSEGAPVPHAIPDRAPDHIVQMPTRPEQALIYRLSGDYNPLHADPEAARQVGFPNPILHGLATYGIAGRAVLQTLCGNRPERFKRFDARFSKPVYPGEALQVEIWDEGDGEAAVRVRAIGRDDIVLQNGYVRYLGDGTGD